MYIWLRFSTLKIILFVQTWKWTISIFSSVYFVIWRRSVTVLYNPKKCKRLKSRFFKKIMTEWSRAFWVKKEIISNNVEFSLWYMYFVQPLVQHYNKHYVLQYFFIFTSLWMEGVRENHCIKMQSMQYSCHISTLRQNMQCVLFFIVFKSSNITSYFLE